MQSAHNKQGHKLRQIHRQSRFDVPSNKQNPLHGTAATTTIAAALDASDGTTGRMSEWCKSDYAIGQTEGTS